MSRHLGQPGAGDFLAEASSIARRHILLVVIFALVLAAISAATSTVLKGPWTSLADMPAVWIGSYLLTWQIFAGEGLATKPRSVIAFFLSLIGGLCVGIVLGLGFALLLFPGLFMLARLSMVTSFIIARGLPIGEAFSESWRQTRPLQWPIVRFFLLVLVIFFVAVIAVGMASGISAYISPDGPAAPVGRFAAQFVTYAASGLMVCVNVAVFALVEADDPHAHEIFA